MDKKTPGQIAFEAYRKNANTLTHDGRQIPEWYQLGDPVRSHWEAAANGLLDEILGSPNGIEVTAVGEVEGEASVEIRMGRRAGFSVSLDTARNLGSALIEAAAVAVTEQKVRIRAADLGVDGNALFKDLNWRP
jgi:hypothetical protein